MPYKIKNISNYLAVFTNDRRSMRLDPQATDTIENVDESTFILQDNGVVYIEDLFGKKLNRDSYLVNEVLENEPQITSGLYSERPTTNRPAIHITTDLKMLLFNTGTDNKWYDYFGTEITGDYTVPSQGATIAVLLTTGVI